MLRPLSALVALCLATPGAITAQDAASSAVVVQEIPKEANVIIARTKLAPSDAYRAAMQG